MESGSPCLKGSISSVQVSGPETMRMWFWAKGENKGKQAPLKGPWQDSPPPKTGLVYKQKHLVQRYGKEKREGDIKQAGNQVEGKERKE